MEREKNYCYQCAESRYVEAESARCRNRFLSGERIVLYCQKHRVNLHVHTHRPRHCKQSKPP